MQTIHEAYATYISLNWIGRTTKAAHLADFVDWLREHKLDGQWSDEEWVTFMLPFVDGDPDVARDLWDALLCQPSYAH